MFSPTPTMEKYRLPIVVMMNAFIVTAGYYVAFCLRFDFDLTPSYVHLFKVTLPWLLLAKLTLFAAFGLYHGWWRYVTLRDLESIIEANLLGSAAFVLIVVFSSGTVGYPRAVFFLETLLSIVGIGGVRALVRTARERSQRRVSRIAKLALIVGAGDAGIQLVRELTSNRRIGMAVVGFVDDDPAKVGAQIFGMKVLGRVAAIPGLVREYEVDEVLVAVPSARARDLRRIVDACQEAKVAYRVLPSMGEIITGKVMYTQMREVKVEDLLARDPVRLEVSRMQAFITGRTALVTGAAGSIGSELCRQLAGHGAGALVLYERNENGLFSLERELRERFPATPLVPILGDILSEDQLERTFATYRPGLVLHAAAYKHVPVAELNPLEAARNNIVGTQNVVRASREHGVEDFVMVSTDKAVRPTNVMGATKRVAEMVVQSQQNCDCKFVSVRFGNVLGSSGSVVSIFREQISRGGPVTVTHPDMHRFFMTIPEAAALILEAASAGLGGEIFVLEMGEAVRIVDLARHMIRLSGYEPDEDISIVFSGLRPGEKLAEELLNDGERVEATFLDRVKILKSVAPSPERLDRWMTLLRTNLHRYDRDGFIAELQSLVPNYTPSAHVTGPAQDFPQKGPAAEVRKISAFAKGAAAL